MRANNSAAWKIERAREKLYSAIIMAQCATSTATPRKADAPTASDIIIRGFPSARPSEAKSSLALARGVLSSFTLARTLAESSFAASAIIHARTEPARCDIDPADRAEYERLARNPAFELWCRGIDPCDGHPCRIGSSEHIHIAARLFPAAYRRIRLLQSRAICARIDSGRGMLCTARYIATVATIKFVLPGAIDEREAFPRTADCIYSIAPELLACASGESTPCASGDDERARSQYNTEVATACARIEALRWNEFIVFDGRKWGIPPIWRGLHREGDCGGSIARCELRERAFCYACCADVNGPCARHECVREFVACTRCAQVIAGGEYY